MAEKTPEKSAPKKAAGSKKSKSASTRKKTAAKKSPAKSAKSTTAAKKKTTAVPSPAADKKASSESAAKTGTGVKKTAKTVAKKAPAPKKKTAPVEPAKPPTEPVKSPPEPAETSAKPAEAPAPAMAADTVKTIKPDKIEKPAKKTPPPPPETRYTPPPPPPEAASDPAGKAVKYFLIGFGILMLLIIGHSIRNTNNYYVVARHGAIEIWQGSFSPMGKKLLLVMPGVQPPEKTKEVYRQRDVFPVIFSFYIEKAEALMDVPGSPDFAGIKKALNQAMSFAITTEMRKTVNAKIDSIDRMILLYKADAAAGRGTVAGLQNAMAYLNKAASLRPGEIESNLINQKLDSVRKQLDLLQPGKAAKPSQDPKPVVKPEQKQTIETKSAEKHATPKEAVPVKKSP